MNICHVINRLSAGGASTVVRNIVQGDAVNTHAICCLEGLIEIDEQEVTGPVTELDERFKFDPRTLVRLRRELKRNEFDCVHLHLPYAQTLGRIAARSTDVEYVISTQHNVPQSHHPITRNLELLTRWFDDATVAVSDGVRRANQDLRVNRLTEEGVKWHTIHNSIDVDEFNKQVKSADPSTLRARHDASDDLVFLTVSRYVPQKAHTDLIAAMESVVEQIPNSQLFLVGRGPLEEDIRQTVQARGLEEHVTVTGYVSEEMLNKYYAMADAFVLSSVKEGFGIVLIEAMAAELPVVATDIAGVNEVVVDGETGKLVPAGEPERLAEAMCTLQSSATRRKLAQEGYIRARNEFSVESSVEEYQKLYQSLASSK